MKKKVISMIISTALLLSACGGGTASVSANTTSSEESVTSSVSAVSDSNEGKEGKEAAVVEPEEAEEKEEITEEDDFSAGLTSFKKEQQIEETILYDQNGIKITATALTYANYEAELGIRMENSTEKDLTFIAESMGYSCNAVNGFMIEDGYLNCDVPAGGSAEDGIGFSYNELLIHGITEIADIQVGFNIRDEDYTSSIYTGPLQVKTAAAESYDYDDSTAYRKVINSKAMQYTYGYEMAAFAEDEVYSSGGISIESEAYMINQDGERSLMIEVKNRTESQVFFTTSNITVNDTEIYDSSWSFDTINARCRALVDIQLDNILDEDEWESYGIEEIETIGFTITVKNADGIVISEPKAIVIGV